MRSIIASLIVFLVVTAALLHRTSAHDAVSQPPTPVVAQATATLPAQLPPSPSATIGRTLSHVAAPAIPPRKTPTAIPPEPTATTGVQSNDVQIEDVEIDSSDESASGPAVGEGTQSDVTGAESAADELHSGIWADAIHTPDGGVMAVVLSESANVRTAPTTGAEVVTELRGGWPVTLYGAEAGAAADGTDIWYRTWSGNYISAATVGPFVAPQPPEAFSGHWVDVDLTSNYVIAYVDETPVYAAIAITGKPGFETPTGTYSIFNRVEMDTLDSSTTGIPDGDPESYRLENVPWVQYFEEGGFAIHANYWSDDWEYGYARSHGCINLIEDDAAWFWQFLTIGSTVSIHY